MKRPSLDYSAAGVSVRDDLQATHREVLDYLAQPGPWFTGAERLAIASESRHGSRCALCRARLQSLSPEHPAGEHDRVSDLSEPLIEMAHRIRSDPQRLSRSWFQRALDAGLAEGEYVEAVGVIAFIAGLDYFCRAIGIEPFLLPAPLPGAPTGHRPAGLKQGTAWVAMLAPEDTSGPEADLYGGLKFVPNIARALSQIPGHVRTLRSETRSHYLDLSDLNDMSVGRDLDRMQIELVAARVSAMNECFY
jgi:alkylhydroperoxidase family enzyme